MNSEQYYKWKEDTFNALVASAIYSEAQASIITKWFDSIKGQTEREMFGNCFIDILNTHFSTNCKSIQSSTDTIQGYVYKTLTARAWLYADAILKEHSEG